MKIPLVNLKRQYLSIQGEIDSVIKDVINNSAFILGEYTDEFEKSFSQYCGVKYCVGLNSGTDGLRLAFLAAGIKHGDEVITVPNTFIATTEPLGNLGARPVFVDIDPKTYLIDTNKIEKAITSRTKAIVPVHLFGQMANMADIMKIAQKHNLKVIEDCAQAHGAEQNGSKAGTFGDVGIYSFYPGKNLGAYGDAGCIITNNKEYYDYIKKSRNHGRINKYDHEYEAYSSRMDGIQAAILNAKLKHIDDWNNNRRKIAEKYNELLPNEIEKPIELKGNRHVYHLYVIRLKNRDKLLQYLETNGIQAGIHYPILLHLQKAYAYLKLKKGTFPVSENIAEEIISLPLFPELKDDEIQFIVEALQKFIKNER